MSLTEDARKLKSEFPYVTLESLRKIPKKTALKDSTPLVELDKLSKLIKSHATKLGIISTPEKLFDAQDAFKKQLTEFMNVLFYLLTLVPLFHDSHFADYFIKKLDNEIVSLISSVHKLSDELLLTVQSDADSEPAPIPQKENGTDGRLVSIGMIWSQCDSLELLAAQGNIGLLNENISSSVKLLLDSINEIEEWLQDPVISSDPFDIGESSSDNDAFDDENEDEEAPESMIKDVKIVLQRCKLLKLLLSSLCKSIEIKKDSSSTAASLSALNNLHSSLVSNSDTLISSMLMQIDYASDPDFESSQLAVKNEVNRIIKILNQLNQTDGSKLKWIQVWNAKWIESWK